MLSDFNRTMRNYDEIYVYMVEAASHVVHVYRVNESTQRERMKTLRDSVGGDSTRPIRHVHCPQAQNLIDIVSENDGGLNNTQSNSNLNLNFQCD